MENHWSKSSFLQSEPCTWRVSRSGESFRTSSTHPLHWQVEDVEDVEDGNEEGGGLTARFDYRYLLLKDLMNPKSAGPFILDAHSLCTGSSV